MDKNIRLSKELENTKDVVTEVFKIKNKKHETVK